MVIVGVAGLQASESWLALHSSTELTRAVQRFPLASNASGPNPPEIVLLAPGQLSVGVGVPDAASCAAVSPYWPSTQRPIAVAVVWQLTTMLAVTAPRTERPV
jgi:hypothetical protein